MAKAINWPQAYRTEVLAEDCDTERCAFRLGNLYYDNCYWVDGEVVDIRVNHLKVRKALVVGDLKQCPVGQLGAREWNAQKSDLKSVSAVLAFLSRTYDQPVDENTLVTVVYYKNMPVVPEEMEEPDDIRPQ